MSTTRASHNIVVNRDPETVANQLLSRTKQDGPPVELDGILEDWAGIRTVYAPLSGAGYLIEQEGLSACIMVEKDSEKTRRSRFTQAHEMGHWILHRFAEKAPSKGLTILEASHDEIEHWCDRFATSILMPSSWVKKFSGEFEHIGRPQVMFGGPMVFDVSREAFYRRLEQIYRVVVVETTAPGKITAWSRNLPHLDEKTRTRLMKHISLSDWKSAQKEPVCKGPFRFGFASSTRWVVMIATC